MDEKKTAYFLMVVLRSVGFLLMGVGLYRFLNVLVMIMIAATNRNPRIVSNETIMLAMEPAISLGLGALIFPVLTIIFGWLVYVFGGPMASSIAENRSKEEAVLRTVVNETLDNAH